MAKINSVDGSAAPKGDNRAAPPKRTPSQNTKPEHQAKTQAKNTLGEKSGDVNLQTGGNKSPMEFPVKSGLNGYGLD